ncbi:MAG: tRNA lysidine(34) synthetase TilS [Candidatus Schekmanbacteria bacterium]|nr:MAG: tRNA lysidine(34) synthetase TilS [Candidatus Schekmanbacteria bacterium]
MPYSLNEKDPPVRKSLETVEKYNMLKEGEKVLIALSGGPDSIFLLHLFNDFLKTKYSLKLHIAHLNHGIREGESERDEEFVIKTADNLGIDITIEKIDAFAEKRKYGTSLESACHFERIGFLRETAKKITASKIALGHTLDDRIESFFMNVLRGTGVSGMKGISPVNKKYNIIRPLIDLAKKEIEEYLSAHQIEYVKDSSNLVLKYERNIIRSKLIPSIEEIKPSFKSALRRSMNAAADDDDFLNDICKKEQNIAIIEENKDFILLNKEHFKKLHRSIGKRLLIIILAKYKSPKTRISSFHIERALEFICQSKHGTEFHLPSGIRFINSYGKIFIKIISEDERKEEALSFINPPSETKLNGFPYTISSAILERNEVKNLKSGQSEAFLDLNQLSLPLKVRRREEGDFFYPLGNKGKKKLKDFFINLKIPKDERDKIPIVLSGDDIVWVAGYRINDKFKVTKNTKKILHLKIKK